jgi:hypothetical protein
MEGALKEQPVKMCPWEGREFARVGELAKASEEKQQKMKECHNSSQ